MDSLNLIVDHIEQETRDTSTFYFKPADGKRVDYQAGQFITLIFAHHNEEVRRSYSLSSSPDEELLSITVKRVQNGEISRYMLAHVKPGDSVTAIQPAGRFLLPDHLSNKQVIYFAAGSGIVPIYAQLKYALKHHPDAGFTLIYSSQSEDDVIFKEQLNWLSNDYANRFKINYHISNNGDRLNNLRVEQLVKRLIGSDYSNTLFYICGPFAYMRMVEFTLHFEHVPAAQIKKENFVLETVPVTSAITTFPPKKIRILFRDEWHDVIAGENQSILQAALQNNINLPYSCRSGICSSCTALCTAGKVEVVKNEVLTPDDLAKGYILTCTGHALEDGTEIRFYRTTSK